VELEEAPDRSLCRRMIDETAKSEAAGGAGRMRTLEANHADKGAITRRAGHAGRNPSLEFIRQLGTGGSTR
jgi:hypothetical protein